MVTRPGALARWRAHLEEVLGVEDAAEVLDPFATVEWDQLATRADLLPLRADIDGLRRELDGFRREMRQEFDGFRREMTQEFGGFRDGMRQEFRDFRQEMRREQTAFQQEVRGDIKDLRRDLLRVTGAQFFALAAAVGALVGFA